MALLKTILCKRHRPRLPQQNTRKPGDPHANIISPIMRNAKCFLAPQGRNLAHAPERGCAESQPQQVARFYKRRKYGAIDRGSLINTLLQRLALPTSFGSSLKTAL